MDRWPRGLEQHDRYRIVRQLGEGGGGLVYEAEDLQRGHRVALKTLHDADPERLFRLKHEFRSVSDIEHPNLVTLYELEATTSHCFYTMELIEGVDVVTYCRAVERDDVVADRVRAVFAQIVAGVGALHDAGKLHRDIKPSNALVTGEGRVFLLDFGLIADAAEDRTLTGQVRGTAAYMSPEQARADEALTRASDWYSVGVTMFEALTGERPIDAPALETLRRKQTADRLRPSTRCAGVPADLDDLCAELLSVAPAARPTRRAIAERLSGAPAPPATPSQPSPPSLPFVGRDRELAELTDRFVNRPRDQPTAVLVRGPSGIGKTALVREFVADIRRDDSSIPVLSGRCLERETVPYKAVDGLIDSLSSYWCSLPRDEQMYLLPREADLLPRMFPVLGRVPAVSAVPRTHEIASDRELRWRVIKALREVLHRLAARRTVVLALDDLQWIDHDTVALLLHVFQQPDAPPVFTILSTRAVELELLDILRVGLEQCLSELDIGALDERDAVALATQLLGDEAAENANRIAAESEGSPFFLDALARYAASTSGGTRRELSLDDMLRHQVEQLPPEARAIVEVASLAGEPISGMSVGEAAGLERPALATHLRTTIARRLVRAAGGDETDLIEPYHDRVRESVAAGLGAERRREIHERLALALNATGTATAEQLARHWLAAGNRDKAADCAYVAALEAETELAFDLAARLHVVALECGPPRGVSEGSLRERLADALANAGRGAAAAEQYLDAAKLTQGPHEIELRRRAAEQLLGIGHTRRGLEVLSDVLEAVGIKLPSSPYRALPSLLLGRLRSRIRGSWFRERTESECNPRVLQRIDMCWSASIGLALMETIRGADFATRHLRYALAAGEPYRACRALATEAGYASSVGWHNRRRSRQLLQRATELAERLDHPHAIAFCRLIAGISRFQWGRWSESLEHTMEAHRMLRDKCTGVSWEVVTAQLFVFWDLGFLGNIEALERRGPEALRDAEERGNPYALATVRSGLPTIVWLARDDADGARDAIESVERRFANDHYLTPHFWGDYALGNADLYAGDGERSYESLLEKWTRYRYSQLPRVQHVRINMNEVRARAALQVASSRSARAAGALRDAERLARALARESSAWGEGMANVIRGGAACVRDDAETALRCFELGETQLAELDMTLWALAARRRRGEVLGGDEGRALIESADAALAERRVRNPERFVEIFAPGRRVPRSLPRRSTRP